jgi:RNA polymerase sigma factor (sigma-70 family)
MFLVTNLRCERKNNQMALADQHIDVELLAGDAEAFGRFYARHEDFVLSVLLRRCGSAELAADLTAEMFARALAGRNAFDPSRGEPRGWLYGIARHVLSDSLARGRVEDSVRRELGLRRLSLDDEAITRIEGLIGDVALAALDGLPEDQRIAVQSREEDDPNYRSLLDKGPLFIETRWRRDGPGSREYRFPRAMREPATLLIEGERSSARAGHGSCWD